MTEPSDEQVDRALRAFYQHTAVKTFPTVAREQMERALEAAALSPQAPVSGEWPEPKVVNPDIPSPTGVPYLDCLLDRMMDAQQDVNLAANETMKQSLADAAALYDEIERAICKLAALASPPSPEGKLEHQLFDIIEAECWTLKCESYPTGGDDAEVGWEVISYWQAEPRERVEGRGSTPLKAMRDALAKPRHKFNWPVSPEAKLREALATLLKASADLLADWSADCKVEDSSIVALLTAYNAAGGCSSLLEASINSALSPDKQETAGE